MNIFVRLVFFSRGIVLNASVLLCCVIALVQGSANAADGDFVRVKGFGGASGDYGYDITVDASGNVFTVGAFQGTVDFDPGPGTYNLVSEGNYDVFISKLDSTGNFVWARRIGSTYSDMAQAVAVDSTGNVYATGDFFGTVDFDPGAGVFNLATGPVSNDLFIVKLDNDGNFVWAGSIHGDGINDVYDIFVDTSGNIYTTGCFTESADFDPGVGTFSLTTSYVFDRDIFISKLDSSGNNVWARSFGSTGYYDYGNSIVVDSSGNVLSIGEFRDTVDFDPGAGVVNLTETYGTYVIKLDSNGDYVWATSLPSSDNNHLNSIATDTAGNVYTTGVFYGTVDFDPGPGVSNLDSNYGGVYARKLDSSGNFVWAKSWGTSSGMVYGMDIAVDTSANVYVTGRFYSSLPADFDPGPGTVILPNNGGYDLYVLKLDSNGNYVWASAAGGAGSYDAGFGIALDSSANVYVAGVYNDVVDFDPGPGVVNLTPVGSSDVYIDYFCGTASHVVSPSATGIGSITPADAQAIDDGQTIQFSFTADPRYYISSISGCGISYTNSDTGIATRDETTTVITGNCTVSAVFLAHTCYEDGDGDGYGSTTTIADNGDGVCLTANGESDLDTDCDDTDAAINPGETEIVADGIDQNCDTQELCYQDNDGDLYGSTSTVFSADLVCIDPGESGVDSDCNDTDAAINPGETEIVADGIDQNCDSQELCYQDNDGDLYGSISTVSSGDLVCTDPGESEVDTDCNDGDAAINPGETEIVADGIDQNCDTQELCYQDNDGDLYGSTSTVSSADLICTDPGESEVDTDCNDGDAAINPGETEIVADGIDQNCDTQELCYQDNDGDLYGSTSTVSSSDLVCTDPGESGVGTDCDDSNTVINPFAIEICDTLDNNCDGSIDENQVCSESFWLLMMPAILYGQHTLSPKLTR